MASDAEARAGWQQGDAPEKRPAALTEWEAFVVRHQNPWNLVIHFVSFVFFFGGLGAAAILGNPWYLAFFSVSGLVGAFGHWVTGDGGVSVREATIQLMVPVYVGRMFASLALGTYGRDSQRAFAKLAALETLDALELDA